jgi:tRNA(adenine34) deaminase
MSFSNRDKEIMSFALEEAKSTLKEGNFPIGAALTINGNLIDVGRNLLYVNEDWYSHAENNLIQKYSRLIREETKKSSRVELFSTIEPCLMCFGTALLHRIPRVVFACPDPHGGIVTLEKDNFPLAYRKRWPKIEGGLLAKDSRDLMINFLEGKNTKIFNQMISAYRNIKI